jgi:hypothetical protein
MNSNTKAYCKECNKSFKTQSNLKQHLQLSLVHNNKEKLCCKYCENMFDSHFSVSRHEVSCKYKEKHDFYEASIKMIKEEYDKKLQDIKSQIEHKEETNKQLELRLIEYKERIKHQEREYMQIERTLIDMQHSYTQLEKKYDELETNYKELSCEHYKLVGHSNATDKHFNDILNRGIAPSYIINNNSNNNTINTKRINNNIQMIASSFCAMTSDFVQEQIKNINPTELAYQGSEYLAIHALQSEIGKNLIISDAARSTGIYKNKSHTVIRDHHLEGLTSLLVEEISKTDAISQAVHINKEVCDSNLGSTDFDKYIDINTELKDLKQNDHQKKCHSKIKKVLTQNGKGISHYSQSIPSTELLETE